MPKYFLIGGYRLMTPSGRKKFEIGSIVEFEGEPGAGMIAVNAAGWAAKQRVRKQAIARGTLSSNEVDAGSSLEERRLLGALTTTIRQALERHEYRPPAPTVLAAG